MIGLLITLALVVALAALLLAGTGRNRQGIIEWRFGQGGLTRFGTYDSPSYPMNREARRIVARERNRP